MNKAARFAPQRSLQEVSALLISEQTVAHTLTSVASLAVASVSGAMFGGITMMVDDRVGTYAFTDPTCAEIDQAQYGSGRGPCLEAFRSGAVIVVDSLAVDRRFPEFSASAMAHGVRSTLSVPMLAGATSVGALNLYAGVEHAFGDHENQTGRLLAAQAAVVLVNAQAYWGAHLRGEQLQMALQSREPIDIAKGIIMHSMGCGPGDAFDVLVKHRNVKPQATRRCCRDRVSSREATIVSFRSSTQSACKEVE